MSKLSKCIALLLVGILLIPSIAISAWEPDPFIPSVHIQGTMIESRPDFLVADSRSTALVGDSFVGNPALTIGNIGDGVDLIVPLDPSDSAGIASFDIRVTNAEFWYDSRMTRESTHILQLTAEDEPDDGIEAAGFPIVARPWRTLTELIVLLDNSMFFHLPEDHHDRPQVIMYLDVLDTLLSAQNMWIDQNIEIYPTDAFGDFIKYMMSGVLERHDDYVTARMSTLVNSVVTAASFVQSLNISDQFAASFTLSLTDGPDPGLGPGPDPAPSAILPIQSSASRTLEQLLDLLERVQTSNPLSEYQTSMVQSYTWLLFSLYDFLDNGGAWSHYGDAFRAYFHDNWTAWQLLEASPRLSQLLFEVMGTSSRDAIESLVGSFSASFSMIALPDFATTLPITLRTDRVFRGLEQQVFMVDIAKIDDDNTTRFLADRFVIAEVSEILREMTQLFLQDSLGNVQDFIRPELDNIPESVLDDASANTLVLIDTLNNGTSLNVIIQAANAWASSFTWDVIVLSQDFRAEDVPPQVEQEPIVQLPEYVPIEFEPLPVAPDILPQFPQTSIVYPMLGRSFSELLTLMEDLHEYTAIDDVVHFEWYLISLSVIANMIGLISHEQEESYSFSFQQAFNEELIRRDLEDWPTRSIDLAYHLAQQTSLSDALHVLDIFAETFVFPALIEVLSTDVMRHLVTSGSSHFSAPPNQSGSQMRGQSLQYIGVASEMSYTLYVVSADTIRIMYNLDIAQMVPGPTLRIPLVLRNLNANPSTVTIINALGDVGFTIPSEPLNLAPPAVVHGAVVSIDTVAVGYMDASLSTISVREQAPNTFQASNIGQTRGFSLQLEGTRSIFVNTGMLHGTNINLALPVGQGIARPILTWTQFSTNPLYSDGNNHPLPRNYSYAFFNQSMDRIEVVFGLDMSSSRSQAETLFFDSLRVARRDQLLSTQFNAIGVLTPTGPSSNTGVRGSLTTATTPFVLATLGTHGSGSGMTGWNRVPTTLIAGQTGIRRAFLQGNQWVFPDFHPFGISSQRSRSASVRVENVSGILTFTLTDHRGDILRDVKIAAIHVETDSPSPMHGRVYTNVVNTRHVDQDVLFAHSGNAVSVRSNNAHHLDITFFLSADVNYSGPVYVTMTGAGTVAQGWQHRWDEPRPPWWNDNQWWSDSNWWNHDQWWNQSQWWNNPPPSWGNNLPNWGHNPPWWNTPWGSRAVHIATVRPGVDVGAGTRAYLEVDRSDQDAPDIFIRELIPGALRPQSSIFMSISDVRFQTPDNSIIFRPEARLFINGDLGAILRHQGMRRDLVIDITRPSFVPASIRVEDIQVDVPAGVFRAYYNLILSGNALIDNNHDELNFGTGWSPSWERGWDRNWDHNWILWTDANRHWNQSWDRHLRHHDDGFHRFAFDGGLVLERYVGIGIDPADGSSAGDDIADALRAHVIVAADRGHAIVDGENVMLTTGQGHGNLTTPPINWDGRLYIPVRALSLIFGARNDHEILWNYYTRTVSLFMDGTMATWQPGSSMYTVDGVPRTMTAQTFIATSEHSANPNTWDRLYLPFRYFGYAFGLEVSWDYEAEEAHFNSPRNLPGPSNNNNIVRDGVQQELRVFGWYDNIVGRGSRAVFNLIGEPNTNYTVSIENPRRTRTTLDTVRSESDGVFRVMWNTHPMDERGLHLVHITGGGETLTLRVDLR